jgi:hypothetical protein
MPAQTGIHKKKALLKEELFYHEKLKKEDIPIILY